MKTRKVGIIGLGHVGAHVAYSLADAGHCGGAGAGGQQ